jgi:putative tricarboxylic transport membrane protein
MLANLISGGVLLALCIAYYLSAAAMPPSILDTTVPSSAFPKVLAICGALLSVALIGQALFSASLAKPRPADTLPAPKEPGRLWYEHKRALGLLGIVLLFVLALEIVGYPVAIGLLILAVSRYGGYPLSAMSLAVAVGGGLFFWLFFMVLLGIHMPLGFWSRLFAAAQGLPFA